ncbi:MAG: hypothetical protein ABFS12_12975 [Bacteroidota bacterium]
MKHLFSFLLAVLFSFAIQAQVPRVINYQGMLLGSDEQPVPEGNYKITFSLYEEDGTQLWTTVHEQVFIVGGIFHVHLEVSHELPFDHQYFLGIKVGDDTELQPRMLLTSAAYSLNSERVGGIKVSAIPEPNTLCPLGNDGKFPETVLPSLATGNFIKKNEPDTSRATNVDPLLLVSNLGTGDGINGRSKDGVGVSGRSENENGVSGWTGVTGKSGVFGNSVNGKGVVGRSDNDDGVTGWTSSSDKSGVFGHCENGFGVTGRSDNKYGVVGYSKISYGGYFRSDNDHLDLALGGAVGRINTDPNNQNSELILSSNHDVTVRLDNDGGEGSTFRIKNSGGQNVCTINEDGNMALYYEGSKTVELGTGLDYAEGFNVSDKFNIDHGTVLIIDPENPGKLSISDKAYDFRVAGIVAGAKGLNSGVRLGIEKFDFDVALAGRVYCNVDANYGEVEPGDLLTTSPTPGYAMVVKDYDTARGAILGKAMEKLSKGKKDQILVLVTLQ